MPQQRLPGEAGLWVFVFGDLLIFTLFFATYLLYRDDALGGFRDAQTHLNLTLGTSNTLLLLTSSFFLASGVKALRAGSSLSAKRMLMLTVLLGGLFVAGKVFEYVAIADSGYSEAESTFFMFYFVFTGIHLIHVFVGLIVLSIFTILIRSDDTSERFVRATESGATYWHMVDLLWIVLFTLFYLLP